MIKIPVVFNLSEPNPSSTMSIRFKVVPNLKHIHSFRSFSIFQTLELDSKSSAEIFEFQAWARVRLSSDCCRFNRRDQMAFEESMGVMNSDNPAGQEERDMGVNSF